jgi:hypothetical protein
MISPTVDDPPATGSDPRPLVLFGAFDRHNLGDILLAHLAAARSHKGAATFAGLVDCDFTSLGGQRVTALDSLSGPVNLLHVGGELLDCDAGQAAYMLGRPALRLPRRAPYVVARHDLPAGSRVEFRAVGGVDLARRDAGYRTEVFAALREAEAVGVRDLTTQAELAAAGIAAKLEPDPAAAIADVFGDRIRALVRHRDPYLAVQFAAECGDDASLTALAGGLERIGLPVLLFRAGAAPWHDDLEPYRRLAARFAGRIDIADSLDVWDICALIAGSRGYVGTSLHCRIVAESFAVTAVSLERRRGTGRKLRAYLATWHPDSEPLDPAAFADAAIDLLRSG